MKRLAVLAVVLGALAAPALAHAAAPPIARPDPVLYPVRLDYTNPLPGSLAPLGQGVIMASVRDDAGLAYGRDDLGGFGQARIGVFPLTSGGRDVLLPGKHATQIPLFKVAGGGTISSFTFTSPPTGPTPPPDNGSGPGITPPPPPSPGENVPPANQGFGGTPGGGSSGGGSTTTTTGGGGTTTRKRPPPTTTTTTTVPPVTTAPSTTTIAASGGGSGGGGSGGGGGSACSGGSCSPGVCGTPGISITSTIPSCTIVFGNGGPGDSTSEILTITNTSGSPYTLSLRASGPHNSSLWQNGPDGLLMGVWDISGPAPGSFPTLFSWTTGYWPLTTLNPGQTVQYEIELFLPTTVGNADQNKAAVIDFNWMAS